jgi:hypothetical protein
MDIQYINQLVHLTKYNAWEVSFSGVFCNKGTQHAKLGFVSLSLNWLNSVYCIILIF